ncbi:PepSY-associated TM helix domain-containing protein, partial [Acinetobacter baumannii]|uniref:PepSY-associated TM helix domain-containing protein n=1 Tax=Acinetobacter baumannii TaxID=470 RepID=UPI0033226BE9
NPRVEVTYLRRDAEHERARNRLYLDTATGEPIEHRRYAELSAPARLVNSIYPLHMGSFWGPLGQVVMVLASAGLLLFAITGWLLYL